MADFADNELIVLMDDSGREIGAAPKLASHHANTPLHKAFSCYVFNTNNELLVTRRALSKKVWPGVWTNSFCGHPAPGESDMTAITRRAKDELGLRISEITCVVPTYRYKTPLFEGVIEHEICPIYCARTVSELVQNPLEVCEHTWMDWKRYITDLQNNPSHYSYWALDQLPRLQASKLFNDWLN